MRHGHASIFERLNRRKLKRRRAGLGLAAACVCVIAAGCSGHSSDQGIDQINAPTTIPAGSSSALLALTKCKYHGCATVTKNVAAGTKVSVLPADIQPSLDAATHDVQLPVGLGFGGSFVKHNKRNIATTCVVPEPEKDAPTMVLLGDSQARIWSGTIGTIAIKSGYSFRLVEEDNCHISMMTFLDSNNTPNRVCDAWRTAAIKSIVKLKPQMVVIATQDVVSYDAHHKLVPQTEYGAGLKKAIKMLSATNRRIVVIGNAPYFANFGPACLAANKGHVQQCTATAKQAVLVDNGAALERAALASGATFVNVVPWFCTAVACPQVINNTVVYENPGHFTGTYARQLATVMKTELGISAPTPTSSTP